MPHAATDPQRRHRHRGLALPRRHLRRRRNHHPHRRAISKLRPDAEVIDATGKLVFPGFIDPHVHIYLPFMATFAKDTHETGSIAALVGGTTTYIEMCCPSRMDDALEGYQLWKSKAEGTSACDYTFHMSVTKFEDQTEGQLREIVADGIASFKIFLAYKNFFGVDDGEMYQTLQLARKTGRDRHRALRKCRTGGPPAAESARARQDRTRMARAQPSRIGRGGRHATASPRFSKTPARRATWCICPAKPALDASDGRQVARRAGSGSNPCCRISCSTKPTRNGRASKA